MPYPMVILAGSEATEIGLCADGLTGHASLPDQRHTEERVTTVIQAQARGRTVLRVWEELARDGSHGGVLLLMSHAAGLGLAPLCCSSEDEVAEVR